VFAGKLIEDVSTADNLPYMHKGRPNVQVAHITMPTELRKRLERSSEGSYRTLNMQMQYLLASSLDRLPALPSPDSSDTFSSKSPEPTKLPSRIDKDLYASLSKAAAERSVSIAKEIRDRLELALTFEATRADNWAALEHQILTILQSNSLSPAQRDGLEESLARCKLDTM
tara:strand:+ start:2707 stop:3219 length:513 start_codon:yes stop_codon:yes gene_type:complete